MQVFNPAVFINWEKNCSYVVRFGRNYYVCIGERKGHLIAHLFCFDLKT